MNKQFVTKAIENDRCLKAHRLLTRFETELRAELKHLGKEMMEANPHLFPAEVNSNIKITWDSSTIIANARDNLIMDRVNKSDPSSPLKLNISLRWVDPIEWGEDDVDGALCAACYKFNGGNQADFDRVKQETSLDEWNLSFGDDQFNNAPGIIYIPVESAEDLQSANRTLVEHFEQFGDHWGVDPADLDAID